MTGERVLTIALAALLILAPLPFGSVEAGSSAALTALALLLAAFWVLLRILRGQTALPWKDPALVGGLCLVAVAAAQLVPLPAPVLEAISPESSALRREFEPGDAIGSKVGLPREEGSRLRPISMYPWATRQALLRFLAFLLVALLVADLSSRAARWRQIALALALSGGFQAIYGLAEFLSGRQHIFGYAKKYYTNVATGTFINRNHFAGFLELTLPFILALAVQAFLNRPRNGSKRESLVRFASGKGAFIGALWWLLALVAGTALLCSRSRMGITSILLALAIVGIGLARTRSGRIFGLASGSLLGLLFILFSQGTAAPLLRRFLQAPVEFIGGVGRWTMWRQTTEMAGAFPILGSGWGSFSLVFPVFRKTGEGMRISHAHNDYLEFAAESGLIGVAILVIAGIFLVTRLVGGTAPSPARGTFGHAAVAALVAIALHSITDFNLAIPANGLAVAIIVGLVLSWKSGGGLSLVKAEGPPRLAAALPACLVCALILSLAAAAAAPAIPVGGREGQDPMVEPAGWAHVADPGNAVRLTGQARDLAGAVTDDLKALMTAAQAGVAPTSEALQYLRRRAGAAAALQVTALREAPTFPGGHVRLGRILATICSLEAMEGKGPEGCLEDTSDQFLAAARIDPMNAWTHRQAARFFIGSWTLLNLRQQERARPLIERAVSMRENRSLLEEWRRIGLQERT